MWLNYSEMSRCGQIILGHGQTILRFKLLKMQSNYSEMESLSRQEGSNCMECVPLRMKQLCVLKKGQL